MKKIKQLLVVAGIFIFVGSFTAQAQTGNTLKDAAKKEQKNLEQEKDKVKDKAKDKAKEKTDAMTGAVKDKTDKIKGDAAASASLDNDKIKILEEKLKKARTDKERQEIKKMMAQEMNKAKKDAGGKMDDAKSDAQAKIDDAKKDASDKAGAISKDDGSQASKNDGNGITKDKVVTKATVLGRAKLDDAQARLGQKEKDLEAKSDLVKSGRARIASAKGRLAAAIATGDLTEDQIAEKQGKIDRAEAGINKLETSINGGKAAYAKQKASLSEVYQN